LRKNTPSLSILFFSSEAVSDGGNKYDFIKETIQLADSFGFEAAWFPERHFDQFGGIFPNPAPLAAAMAMITSTIRLRSGSIILPLHHSIRIAEDWSMVDNLSNGRVDLSFTTGWNENDFVLAPDNYEKRASVMYEKVEEIKTLWKGGRVSFKDGKGEDKPTKIYPKPAQESLNIWITCGGKNLERFVEAGAKGFNILTALLLQSKEELKSNIEAYRSARKNAGYDPDTGRVTLMLHTFVGESEESVRKTVKAPFMKYIDSSVNLWSQSSKKIDELDEYKKKKVLEYAFEKYFHSAALFGTVEQCEKKIKSFQAAGVNEFACLIDYGPTLMETKESLMNLKELL